MKRLTINQVAKANIRINRKAYISLFIGILAAVFLATATTLCAWGTIRGHEEQMAQRVGWMDMFTLGYDNTTDEQIRRSGFFDEIGHVTVNATAEGKPVCAGWYDETAEKLMNRTLKEGRLPEKAGEIAAEQSALIRLEKAGVQVGDTLTLTMQPISGVSEEKTFTLVGILNEQTDYLNTYLEEEGMRFPALLVSPEETYEVGGTVVHRVMTYAPLITLNQVYRNCKVPFYQAFGVSRENGQVVYDDSGWDRAANMMNRILVWAVLGAALMLSACVGITSAMESLLTRKTEDIGMLRAIGATRRQVRRIYGAEAWLLTATALPAGLLSGVMFTWIVSRIAPDQTVFSLNPWLLIPILGLSALCVFIASRVPLYHASRQMPMGVLRDTALLRKAGKIRNHNTFRPDRLIAGRRTRLHPLRQVGAAGMIALMLLSTLLLGEIALGVNLGREEMPAFRLYGDGSAETGDPFSQYIPNETISRAELQKIGEEEGVREIRSHTPIRANLLMERAPEYFRAYKVNTTDRGGNIGFNVFGVNRLDIGGGNDWLFYTDEELADARAREDEDWEAAENIRNIDRMNMIRRLFGLTDLTVPVNVYVTDMDWKALQENVVDGAIDTDRLNSGEQALVYAPALCVKKLEGGGMEFSPWNDPRDIREEDWDVIIRNDAFTAGMTLNLLELSGSGDAVPDSRESGRLQEWYQSMDAVNISVSVGAVLSGQIHSNDYYFGEFAVILSPAGAEALGLKLPNPDSAAVYLTGDPTLKEEEEIKNAINQIAMYGWLRVDNQLEITRAYMMKKTREILLFAGLILLFFAVSVFMQVSGASRRIRSEIRTIGTLRAVGADLRTLVGCYRLPVCICAGAALIPCLLVYAVREIPALRLFRDYHPVIMIPVLILLAACVVLACTAGIRGRLANVTRQSIVDNIREL